MNDNSYEDTDVRDAIRAAAAHEPLNATTTTTKNEPCRCPDDAHMCTAYNCRNNPPFPSELALVTTDDTPPVEWTDHHGDVWQEHPVDPTLVRIVRFANGKLAPEDLYRPLAEVEKWYGELTQTAGAPSTADESETGWRRGAPVEREGESPEARKLGNAAAELENLTVMMKQAVLDLRANSEHASRGSSLIAQVAVSDSYARVYYLRRELGRVVAMLDAGIPRSAVLRGIEKTYRALIED